MNSTTASAKPEDIHSDVICEEYEDEMNDVSEQMDETNNGPRFTSPEASAERLSKLPADVQNALKMMTEENIFTALVNEIQARCQECRVRCSAYDYERMWVHMVRTYCRSFRSQYFSRSSRTTIVDSLPEVVVEYMKTVPLVDLLQTIVDLSQQRGYCAKQRLDSFVGSDGKLMVKQHEYEEAREKCNYLFRCYYSYVDLFRMCTGTWRPSRPARRRNMPQANEGSNRRADDQERSRRPQNFGKPWRQRDRSEKYMTQQRNTSRERNSYQPGSYQMQYQGSRQKEQSELPLTI